MCENAAHACWQGRQNCAIWYRAPSGSPVTQQVPVVQADVRIVNQNARKKQTPPKRVKCGCIEDA
ncbi:hypothetical protein FA798_21025 [Escherichia coli]|nr:hypothetical protein [Escherichia coli]EFC1644398.1 hypothetical protein [Escherichia coli]EFC1656468.1 hypothetical protein [Escherichia coli]